MFDFSQEQLQEILELQPSQDRPELYREGFAEAQQLIHRKLGGRPEAIPSKDIELALEKALSDEIFTEPELAAGMDVRAKVGNQQVQSIHAVGLTSVRVGPSGEGWVRSYGRDSFWQIFELVNPLDELVRKARELSEELTRIEAVIDQLNVAYAHISRDVRLRPTKSKLYRNLTARRLELLQQLVELG